MLLLILSPPIFLSNNFIRGISLRDFTIISYSIPFLLINSYTINLILRVIINN